MDDAAVLEVLAEADSRPSLLPRLGGLARPDGVAIVSERVWCFSRVEGGAPATGQMPRPPALVGRLPLVRGLAKLAVSLAPLLGRRGAARPAERLVLLAALVAPLPIALVPSALTPVFVSLAALTLTMEIWLAAQRWLSPVGRIVLLPGLALQRLTTREPELAETRVALRAVAGVLAADRGPVT